MSTGTQYEVVDTRDREVAIRKVECPDRVFLVPANRFIEFFQKLPEQGAMNG